MKTIIIGNSGSGKTWLANKLSLVAGTPIVHLDELFWEPGGFNKKRPKETVIQIIADSINESFWIVEGVFGELAEYYMEHASCMIWLDIKWPVCHHRLMKRGSESRKHMGREQSEEGLRELVKWASHYYDRTDLRSYAGHKELIDRFSESKYFLRSEEAVNKYVASIQSNSHLN